MCQGINSVSPDALNITVTAAAEKFLRRVLRFSGKPAGAGVRLTVSPGGCSGYNSDFTVQSAPQAGDAVLDVNGLALFLPAASCALLAGVTIDFADTLTQTGLTFMNPKAAACACASSAGTGQVSGQPPGIAKIDIGSIGRTSIKGTPR